MRYTDLVVQVNELIEQGFLTLNQNAAASSATGVELEGTWQASPAFSVEFALGWLNIEISEVDERVQGIAKGDSPALTPNYTASISPRYEWTLASGAGMTLRADWYRRGRMFGQPINTPLNRMPPVDVASLSLAYENAEGDLSLAVYAHNVGNEVYPLAKLDLDPTVLIINSNDRREFGVRLGKRFGGR